MADPTRFSLVVGMDLTGLSAEQLWWRYVALGGDLTQADLLDVVHGRGSTATLQANLVAQVLNEVFLDLGVATFPVGYRAVAASAAEVAMPTMCLRSQAGDGELARRRRAAMDRAQYLHQRAVELVHDSTRLQAMRWDPAMRQRDAAEQSA